MAFAKTETHCTVFGDKRVKMGGYTQASGDTGGAIATGLNNVIYFEATAATVVSNSSGTVTITTADPGTDAVGFWIAIGD